MWELSPLPLVIILEVMVREQQKILNVRLRNRYEELLEMYWTK